MKIKSTKGVKMNTKKGPIRLISGIFITISCIVIILIAVVLQMIRQFLQPSVNFDLFKNKKDRPSHNTTADEAKKSVYDKDKSKYYEE